MKRRRMAALPLLLAALLLGACRREARFDFLELNARLRAADKSFCFPEDAVFYKDGTYYVYCSLQSENDALLSMREDEDGRLDRISLTLTAEDRDAAQRFAAFSRLLAGLFIPDCDLDALCAQTGLDDAALFQETMRAFTQDRYTAVLFGSQTAACFFVMRK